jgi:hypothetical protein|nr:hypothetical protein [uncultured Dongia sp.]
MATPHLQSELAQLLIFVSKVSQAIRSNTAFNSSTFGDRQAHVDAMYLSDTLHRMHRLGRAIIELQPVQISAVCDDLITLFEDYRAPAGPFAKGGAPECFARHNTYFRLTDAIELFQSIKQKSLASLQGDVAP